MARAYRLGKRAVKMAATRQRVLEAAYALLTRDGLASLGLDDVAKAAGVGRTTLFVQFESRTGLLQALEQHVSERAGVGSLKDELTQADAKKALRAAFAVGCGVWAAERIAFRQLFSLAAIDPELRRVMEEKDAVRRLLVEQIVGGLRAQKQLRGSPGRARDLLLVLTSFDTFETLFRERHTADAVAKVLADVTEELLLKA